MRVFFFCNAGRSPENPSSMVLIVLDLPWVLKSLTQREIDYGIRSMDVYTLYDE